MSLSAAHRASPSRLILTKLFKVHHCLRIAANACGRDLVVGDLHGHRGLFEQALEQLDFDPSRDRVLSVGDLINRGPQSLATLSLIEQPWFHAVLGNHELMLLKLPRLLRQPAALAQVVLGGRRRLNRGGDR